MSDVAYRRVSSTDQNNDRQLDGLSFDKEFFDKASAGNTNRPGLEACLEYLREGDTLHVHSIDRLCRNLQDLQSIVATLNGKGIAVSFHKESLIFDGKKNSMNKLMMQIIGAVAEFEKALINERQAEGIAKARAKGKHLGRKVALPVGQVQEIKTRLENGEQMIDLAQEYGVSRQTLYASLKRYAPPAGQEVQCEICKKQVTFVQLHIATDHRNHTLERYMADYPKAPLMTESGRQMLGKRMAEEGLKTFTQDTDTVQQ